MTDQTESNATATIAAPSLPKQFLFSSRGLLAWLAGCNLVTSVVTLWLAFQMYAKGGWWLGMWASLFVMSGGLTFYFAIRLWRARTIVVASFSEDRITFRTPEKTFRELRLSDIKRVEGYSSVQDLDGLAVSLAGGQQEIINTGSIADIQGVFNEIKQRAGHLYQPYSAVMLLKARSRSAD